MKTVRLIIKGRVQGVYYRASAKEVADLLGIKGWVKNLPDSNVEVNATASEETLQKFIAWSKDGPPRAIVDEIIVEEITFQEFNNFKILR